MARLRDYKAEYKRRVASAAKRGLSRSQARGHARSGETPVRPTAIKSDQRLEEALRTYRQTGNQAAAAKSVGISPEFFRRFLRENVKVERRGRLLTITDDRPRRTTVITAGTMRELTLRDFEQASLNGRHKAAVRAFLASREIELLRPFKGRSVLDRNGRPHPLETNPNALYRLDAAGSEVFHNVYRIVL